MGRVTFILAAVLAFAASASAAVTVDFTCNYLYGGYNAFDFYLRTTDGQLASWAANIGFYARHCETNEQFPIHQVKSGTSVVNNEGWIMEDPENPGEWLGEGWRFFEAVNPNYDKDYDTWTYNPFEPRPGSNPIPGGPALSGGYAQNMMSFAFSLGAPEGSQLGDNIPLAHVVAVGADSEVIAWGSIARLGDVVPLGQIGVPLIWPPMEHYVISPGESLNLSMGGTWDIDGGISADRRGYETEGGEVGYAHLESLGLQAGHTYEIRIGGFDSLGRENSRGTTLTITPEPATMAMLAFGGLAVLRRRSGRVLKQR